jgi:hypothetical protein
MTFLSSFSKNYSIQAAGRTFSEKNVARLKAAFVEIADLLIEAGVLDAPTLEELKKEAGMMPANATEVKASAMDTEQLESFSTVVARTAWMASLDQCFQVFHNRFVCLHADSLSDLQEAYGQDVDRKLEIEKLINELAQYLIGLHHIYPPNPDEVKVNPAPIVHPEPTEVVEAIATEPLTPEMPVQLSAVAGVDLSFECPAIPIQASAEMPELENRYPVRGVLFRVGEASEATPAIGPGLPIYIPEEVAQSVIDTIAGLPLDCHDSLSQHSSRESFGVIMSAGIQGKDFVIEGYLHDWSQPEKVQLIQSQRDRLGMSMDASAIGYETTIDGRPVFYVSRLKLKGATILFSDKATYRQTRLLPTSDLTKTEVAEQIAIAAAGELFPVPPTPLEPQELTPVINDQNNQLTSIAQSLESLSRAVQMQSEQLTMHGQIIENLVAKMQMIDDKEQQEQLAIQAAAEQEKEQQKEQQILAKLEAMVQQTVKAVANPNGHARRITTPLAAGAAPVAADASVSPTYQLDMQLSRIEGEIAASQHDLPKIVSLTQQKISLENQRRSLQAQL